MIDGKPITPLEGSAEVNEAVIAEVFHKTLAPHRIQLET